MKKLTVTMTLVVIAMISVSMMAVVGAAQSQGDVDRQTGTPSQLQVSPQDNFAVSDFRAPSQSNTGSHVTARVTVRNLGGSQGTAQVQSGISRTVSSLCAMSNSKRERAEVGVSLRGVVPSLSAGTHRHGVYIGDSDVGQTTEIVLGQQPAAFSVNSINPSSDEGPVASSVSVEATVENTGDLRGSRTVEYRIRNKLVTSQRVSLEPGESRTVTLAGRVPNIAVGTYRQGVYVGSGNNGLRSSFRVTSSGASFGVSALSAPSHITSGETATATATVLNSGMASGTRSLEYRIDGETVATREVTLNAGSRTRVSLQGSVPERSQGTYRQGVFVGRSNVGASSDIVVRPSGSARFTVYDLRSPSHTLVGGGEGVTVTATVENVGEVAGETEVEYRVNGTVVDSQVVEIEAGGTSTVTFDVTVPGLGVGTYQQGVFFRDAERGQTSSLRMTSQPAVTVTGIQAPFSATVGTEVSVRATVRNSDDVRATSTVEYRVGDTVVASEEVEVDAVSSRTVVLQGDVPSLATGTYTQGVFIGDVGISRGIRLREAPTEMVEDDDGADEDGEAGDGDENGVEEDGDEGEDGEGLPGFTALAVVLALLTVSMARRFGRTAEGKDR
ncbi:MAG: CARDB domain-containing protein [Halobacteriales archaeon]|nr:CARDB domain-containing protein [Halobacteriales archaeon]